MVDTLDRYAKLMAEGFKDDPGIRVQFSGIERGDALFELHCKCEIEAYNKLGCVKTVGDCQGMTIGFITQDTPIDAIVGSMQESAHSLIEYASPQELKAMQNNAVPVAEIVKPDWYAKYLEDDHVYVLQVIVVDRSAQGTGMFRKLMTPILDTAKRRTVPVVLQTHNYEHVAKYERVGFRLMETVVSDCVDLSCYNMIYYPS